MTIERARSLPAQDGHSARRLRITVIDHSKDGAPAVNVSLPIGLVRWGLKMAKAVSPDLEDQDLDWDAISQLIEDGATGQIVHVEDDAKHKTVDVWVE